jgi:Rrf2 family protein
MLKISKKSDYGLLLLERLIDEKELVPLSKIIEETKLPSRFLAQIATILVKNEIVESTEGKNGGYRINYKKLQKTNLLDYLSLFETNLSVTECAQGKKCSYKNICRHHSFFNKRLNQILLSELKKYSLLKVLK